MTWVQPRQNSVEALCYGINHFDGVEFDLRLTTDGELVLHHDNTTSSGDYVELLSSEEMKPFADKFDDLLTRKDFTTPWQEQGKTVCIELKSPHPSSGIGGGWRGGSKRIEYISSMTKMVDDAIAEFELPEGTTVLYSFDKKFLLAVKAAGWSHPKARLMPTLREWGSGNLQRAIAAPSFIAHSLPRLMRKHQKWGAPMIPCTLDYLHGMNRHLTLGTSVALTGKGLEKLTKARKGFPAFVWPVRVHHEKLILDAGLTPLTDDASPEITHLPDGSPRITKPASEPLFDGQHVPWHEMTNDSRKEFLSAQRNRWQWRRSVDELVAATSENQIPWEVPRIIGHRGAGKTKF